MLTYRLYLTVHPWGVEPQSSEPESGILSIELWVLALYTRKPCLMSVAKVLIIL